MELGRWWGLLAAIALVAAVWWRMSRSAYVQRDEES